MKHIVIICSQILVKIYEDLPRRCNMYAITIEGNDCRQSLDLSIFSTTVYFASYCKYTELQKETFKCTLAYNHPTSNISYKDL